MKRRAVWILVAVLVVLAGWRAGQKVASRRALAGRQQARNAVVAVVTQPVRTETIRDTREFTGTLSPKTQFAVAPKVPGRLERLLVNIGTEVRNGDPIARLDSQEYERQVEQARAELDVARANVSDLRSALDIAARELDRVQELRKQKVASESELDQAGARHRAAQAKNEVALAQVKQKEAALKADEIRLSYTQIAAVWEDGAGGTRVVGERFADEGAMLRANEPIVSVLDVDTVLATIFVIEEDYPLVQTGQTAEIATDAFPGQTFPGTVVRKAPLLKETSRQARVEIEVANPGRRLAPGMFIRAGLRFAAHENATVVPAQALVRRNGNRGVFVAEEAGKARFVAVTPGITSGDSVEILSPPLQGQVVTLGQHLLEDGSPIVVSRPGGSAATDRGPGKGARP